MDIEAFIKDWLTASNTYDTKSYLEKWHTNAVLDDPSVGQVFKGHSGIKKYFENYFIDYKTQTQLAKLNILTNNTAHIDVVFTGEFPEGCINGTFDFLFEGEKIITAKANLAQ